MVLVISCSTSVDKTSITEKKLHDGWEFKDADDGEGKWMPASVPGVVHMDLLKKGVIEEPFFRRNETKQQWIDKEDWVYQTSFHVSQKLYDKENIRLFFEGLDTYADVYLNDTLLLSANNMHREWKINCKPFIQLGENQLKVFFHSPIKVATPLFDSLPYLLPAINDHSEIGGVGHKKLSVFTRKAHYHYGWDWGPRFVTSGIWRPVYLQAWDKVKIENVFYATKSYNEDEAKILAEVELISSTTGKATINIKNANNNTIYKQQGVTLEEGKNIARFDFTVENPKLWWTHDLGEPHLYQLEANVILEEELADAKKTSFGIRTIKLRRPLDSIGQGFYFELNGEPVYIKGANYIPNDIFVTRVPPEKYENVIASAAEANMNMLRVWGGAIYENNIFYDLCDRYGILVWQDFMFACNMYPGGGAFFNNVREEFIDNVKRLRNHPSIGLWCGNNEMLQAWHHWGWHHPDSKYNWSKKDSAKIWHDYLAVFHDIIPSVLADLDTTRDYWPSSPASDIRVPQNFTSGDYHYWKNRNEKEPVTIYQEKIGRFMSEYGKGGAPEFNSVKQFTLPRDWSGSVRSYAKPVQFEKKHYKKKGSSNYLTRNFNNPKDFQSKLYVSQLIQRMVIKTAVDAHRRSKPHNMGTLFWMMNECWPVSCGSAIDYYGRWKAVLYMLKKSFAPVFVSPMIDKGILKIYLVNDYNQEKEVDLMLDIIDFQGKDLWHHDQAITLAPNSSKVFFQIDTGDHANQYELDKILLRARAYQGEELLSENFQYFKPAKDLALENPEIQASYKKVPAGYEILLSSKTLAKFVFLSIESPVGRFSDNYFDLIPGEAKKILFKTGEGIENIEGKMEISSLIDTYKN